MAPHEQEKRGLLGDSPGSHCQSHQQMIATNIVDKVQVPATIEPGDYLISWRWVRVQHFSACPSHGCLGADGACCAAQDCEQTNQIWQNCGDVTVV